MGIEAIRARLNKGVFEIDKFDDLQKIPSEIEQFDEITSCIIYPKHFKSIPIEICKLKNLKYLEFIQVDSDLEEIPEEIELLKNLETLKFQLSSLKHSAKISSKISELKHLKELSIFINTSIPKEIGDLKSLLKLHIEFNPTKGNLPQELSKLINLKSLHLDTYLFNIEKNYQWEECLAHLISLEELYLSRCENITTSIGNLNNLKKLKIVAYKTNMTEIPDGLFNITGLQSLEIVNANLKNGISENIGKLINLEQLCFYKCNLSDIPSQIGQLKQLKVLDLENNFLKNLPTELESLTKLTQLNIAGSKHGLRNSIVLDSLRKRSDLRILE